MANLIAETTGRTLEELDVIFAHAHLTYVEHR